VSFTAEQARRAAEELRARGILEETLVLSTCNRSEVYGVPRNPLMSVPGLSTFLSEFHSVRPDILSVSLYHHYDTGVSISFEFRGPRFFAAGRSGDPGQVRKAYRFAHEQGATGPVLIASSRVHWNREARAHGNRAWHAAMSVVLPG